MDSTVATSYRVSRGIARARARNFYFGIWLLPRERRDALCAIYAFMRHADDVADGDAVVADKMARLREWRADLDRALAGDCAGNPILPAFHHAATRYRIPPEYFHELLAGAEMDLTVHAYATFDDLYQYCYRVASVVGLCSLQVFGFSDPAAKNLAERCGVAFQLTNILRDLREDAATGRTYLPEEDLRKFGLTPASVASSAADSAFVNLVHFEAQRAREFYEQSRPLIGMVHKESRPALWTMISIYWNLLETIDRNPAAVLRGRVSLPTMDKAMLAARGAGMRIKLRLGMSEGGKRD